MQQRSFLEAVANRRSCYRLGPNRPISEDRVIELVDATLRTMPSAFNTQSTRIVILFGAHHKTLWKLVLEALHALLPPEAFENSREKVETSFAAGWGTLLFYEDMAVIDAAKRTYATYADQMECYAEHTSAMHQLALWTLLEEAGLGASLQHYNPLIEERVARQWSIHPTWRMVAQMPFGSIDQLPAPHPQLSPIETRRAIYR